MLYKRSLVLLLAACLVSLSTEAFAGISCSRILKIFGHESVSQLEASIQSGEDRVVSAITLNGPDAIERFSQILDHPEILQNQRADLRQAHEVLAGSTRNAVTLNTVILGVNIAATIGLSRM